MRRTFLLPLLLCAACGSSGSTVRTEKLSTEVFEDLPAPKGAIYRSENGRSFSFRSRSFRCGRFLFDYDMTAASAARFYKETMTQPPYGWTLADEETVGEGAVGLVFLKNEDRCTVRIHRLQDRVEIIARVNLDS